MVNVSERPVADKHLFNKAMILFFPANVCLQTGDMGNKGHKFAELWLQFEETTAKGAYWHPDADSRVLMQQLVNCGTPWEACVRHKGRFSYDNLYGEGGELLRKAIRSYKYEVRSRVNPLNASAEYGPI